MKNGSWVSKGMTRKKWPKALEKLVYDKSGGKCHHCGKKLSRNPRKGWQIDHFPVPHRDVESQLCCGVTDTLDPTNLVLSCPPCNMSHRHEISRWYFCGHAQFPCFRWFWQRVGYTTGILTSAALGSVFTYFIVKC